MQLNGSAINRFSLDGGARVIGAPVGQYYKYYVLPKTDFVNFNSFLTGANAPKIIANVPLGCEIQVANRFSPGGPVVYNIGFGPSPWLAGENPSDWPNYVQWNAMPVETWTKLNGFVPANNYFEVILALRTPSAAIAAAVDAVQIGYSQGALASVVSVINLVNPMPVAGAASLAAGLYLFDTVNGYRLESGASDITSSIAKSITSQKVQSGDGALDIVRKIEVEIESDEDATVVATPIVEGVDQTSRAIAVTAGTRKYPVGVDRGAPGISVAIRNEWTAATVKVLAWHFWTERAGTTRP
jgi:hypothetical protein